MKNAIRITTLFLSLTILSSCFTSKKDNRFDDIVLLMHVDEPIDGVCDNNYVTVIMPFEENGQIKAEPVIGEEELIKRLNTEVPMLEGKTQYNDTISINVIISCEGKLVQSSIGFQTQYPELDEQILSIFQQLETWVPASIKGKKVDSFRIYSFTIKNGEISIS
jgi:hypothetical protein